MKELILVLVLVLLLVLFTFFMQPKCPKCKSKGIGLFTFHGKKIFSCHDCGYKGLQSDL
jgi:ribosomal protein L37AE/L43A